MAVGGRRVAVAAFVAVAPAGTLLPSSSGAGDGLTVGDGLGVGDGVRPAVTAPGVLVLTGAADRAPAVSEGGIVAVMVTGGRAQPKRRPASSSRPARKPGSTRFKMAPERFPVATPYFSTGSPAAAQSRRPPCMLITSSAPAACRMLAPMAERAPVRQRTATGLLLITSRARSGR